MNPSVILKMSSYRHVLARLDQMAELIRDLAMIIRPSIDQMDMVWE